MFDLREQRTAVSNDHIMSVPFSNMPQSSGTEVITDIKMKGNISFLVYSTQRYYIYSNGYRAMTVFQTNVARLMDSTFQKCHQD